MRTAIVTEKQLRKYLSYNARTGNFHWRVKRQGNNGVGSIAGAAQKDGYIVICLFQRKYYAHRLAWLWTKGSFPKSSIDHINGKKADNRIGNLRLASPAQNTVWRKLNKNNTSGFRGVSWFKPAKRWSSRIKVGGKHISLGYYEDAVRAAEAYDMAAVKHFGVFAKTNGALGLYR
jgi:HNH endonuclease